MSTPSPDPTHLDDPYSTPAPPSGSGVPPTGVPTTPDQPASHQHHPYGPPAPGHQQPHPPSSAPGTDGVSIAALVTGVLLLGPVALGLGIAGIVRTKGGRRTGRGLAITGVVLGGLSTIFWALVAAGITLFATSGEARASFMEGYMEGFNESFQEATGTDLAVGDCFESPADLQDGGALEQVECSAPHEAEVIGLHHLEGGDFPGLDAIYTEGDALCLDSFESYLGVDYYDSTLDFVYFHPSGTSWTFGDRLVLCAAVTMDGSQLPSGSVELSGI